MSDLEFFIMLQNSGHFIITNFYSVYIYHLPEVIGSIHLIYADKELKPFCLAFVVGKGLRFM